MDPCDLVFKTSMKLSLYGATSREDFMSICNQAMLTESEYVLSIKVVGIKCPLYGVTPREDLCQPSLKLSKENEYVP